MHRDNSRGRGRLCAPPACTVGALVGVLWLSACGTLRVELCTGVRKRMLEELRTSEGTAHSVMDPWECEKNARRLHELAEELREVEHRDATLRGAVEGYRGQVEGLADAYARLADAYQDSAQLPPAEAERVREVLSRGVLEHAAALNLPRFQLQSACNDP